MAADASSIDDDRERRLGEAIDTYIESVRLGTAPSEDSWVRRYPDLAGELKECLAAIRLLRPAPGSVRSDVPGAAPRIEGYEILELIGRGGMGIVYKGVRLPARRIVAIKLLAAGVEASPGARRRFEREIELAAALDHPGIVQIVDSGECEGRAFLAMEFVEGRPLHVYMREEQPAVGERLRLFIEICQAVQYAHLRTVIHRDLKPTNILVDRDRHPRILDFGLARMVTGWQGGPDISCITQEGQLVGTLPYLSPEQASGDAGAVDIRSDLYALGVILFEMLTGRQPYDTSGSLAEALSHICHTIPPRPSHFARGIGSDLDAIVLKALEKFREKRYQTAEVMAEDIRCHLRGEPVEANRTSRFYLLRKAYARHRTGVHLAAAAFTFILIASVVITSLYFQVRRERGLLADQLHISTLRRGAAHLAAGHDELARNVLTRAYRERPDRRAYWPLLCYYIQNPLAAAMTRTGWVTCAAAAPDRTVTVVGNLAGELVLFRTDTSERIHRLAAHEGAMRGAAFTHDGAWLATAGDDGDIAIWRTSDWSAYRRERAHPGGATGLRIAATGSRLVSLGKDGRVLIWEPDSHAVFRARTMMGTERITACDISPTGRSIVAASSDGVLLIVDLDAALPPRKVGSFVHPVEAVSIDPDGRSVAAWSGGFVSLWSLESGQEQWRADAGLAEPRPTTLWDFDKAQVPAYMTPHTCWTPCPRFSDDGSLLACGNWGAAVRVWRVEDGRPLAELRSHGTAIYSVAFEPGTHRVFAGLVGEQVLWNLDLHPNLSSWDVQATADRGCAAMSGDGRVVVWTGGPEGSVNAALPGAPTGVTRLKLAPSPVQAVAIDATGRRLMVGDRDGHVILQSMNSSIPPHIWQTGTRLVQALDCSPDGSLLAAGGEDGRVTVWNCETRGVVASWQAHTGMVLSLAFAPDGRHLATGGRDWLARYWEIGNERPLGGWRHTEWVNAVAFSPDGRRLAAAGADLNIRIGPPAGRPQVLCSHAHAHWINAMTFLDAGRVLATGGNDEAVRFWDAQTGDEFGALPSIGGPVLSLAASKDGRKLLIGAARRVQLVDLGAAAELLRRHEHMKER